jgi:superfamily II DNA/RNA helicase
MPFDSLLAQVAVQSTIRVVDVTHNSHGDVVRDGKVVTVAAVSSAANVPETKSGLLVALPQNLTQYEIRAPAEDKDVFCYYFLYKHQGRSLVFVNSIKTARRVDGLLRALGFQCRTIHADLPQKQRLKALDTFKSTPNGVLVATDVAARGMSLV